MRAAYIPSPCVPVEHMFCGARIDANTAHAAELAAVKVLAKRFESSSIARCLCVCVCVCADLLFWVSQAELVARKREAQVLSKSRSLSVHMFEVWHVPKGGGVASFSGVTVAAVSCVFFVHQGIEL